MLNRSAEWGSEHLTLPRIMPSILLTWHLITSGLAFIITNAKPDFVPFEDSGSSNRSIIIRQNNYVALKGRSKKSSSCWVLLSCARNLPDVGAAWGSVSRQSEVTSSSDSPLSRSGSQGPRIYFPIPSSPALLVPTFQSEHEPLHIWGTWRRARVR